jgi:two-component system, LytTR family, response regulator
MTEKILNTVIIDDDAQSRKLLQVLLKKFPQINVVGEAANITNAIEIIKKTKPDSVFLDVCLDDETGFELMKKIETNPKIIFVSAYDNYALRAFDVNALDYIQKPIAPERLAKAVDRLLTSVNKPGSNTFAEGNNGHSPNVQHLNKSLNIDLPVVNEEPDESDEDSIEADSVSNTAPANKTLDYDDRLFITFDGVSKFIKINTVVCITAEKDYSYIYLSSGKKHLVLKSMVEWEERLTPKYFVRIHRSTIVNLEYVEKVEKWFNSSYHVYLQNHAEPFKMSRRYAAKLKERFK